MDETTRRADEILEKMHEIWPVATHRVSMIRKFVVDRNIMPIEASRTAYPMNIAQVMAAKGWTAEKFVRALY